MKTQQLPQNPNLINQTIGIFLLLLCIITCDSNTVQGQNYDFKLDSVVAKKSSYETYKTFYTYDFEKETQKNLTYVCGHDDEPVLKQATYFHNNGQLLIDSIYTHYLFIVKLHVIEHEYIDGKLNLYKRKVFSPPSNSNPYIDEVSEYNDEGYITKGVVNIYNIEDNTLESIHKRFYEYDEMGNITLLTKQIDDLTGQIYNDTTRSIFDEENRLIYTLTKSDDFNVSGSVDREETNEYDEFGNLISNQKLSIYSESEDIWYLQYRKEFSYNSDQQLLSEFNYERNLIYNEEWEIYRSIENEYNDVGKLIFKTEYFGGGDGGNEYKRKTVFHYEEGLNTKKDYFFCYDDDCENWKFESFALIYYTNFSEVSEVILYTNDSLEENFISKEEYVYDINNIEIGVRKYSWSSDLSDWVLSNRGSAIKVNDNVLKEHVYMPFGIVDLISNYYFNTFDIFEISMPTFGMRSSFQYLDSFKSLYRVDQYEHRNLQTANYYYSDYSENGDNSDSDRPGHVYPNPTSNFITIEYPDDWNVAETASFELYDSNGKKMLLKDISNKETINLSNGFSGNYIYHLNANGKKVVGKIMIK